MRKSQAPKRKVLADPIYNSKLVTKTINAIMYEGKKGVAQKIVYMAFEVAEKKLQKPVLEIFNKTMENVMPVLEIRVRRVAGSNYQVPTEVTGNRRIALGLRWLITSARKRNEKTMVERFAAEIIDAHNGVGMTIKKRDDTHKMAEANKAFAHLR